MDYRSGYCSPYLRKAVFDRLHPGSEVTYEVRPIETVFPDGHHDTSESKATEAIRCTIIVDSGQFFIGIKEIDLMEQGKDKKWRAVPQTAEQFTADCTKALGRALRDAGIPQKADELTALMHWVVALDGRAERRVDRKTGEISGSMTPDDVDSPDSGSTDELTEEQQVALAFSRLSGPDKVLLAKRAKEELGVTNLMRSGDRSGAVASMINEINANPEPDFA